MNLLGALLCYNLISIVMIVFGYKYRYKTPKRGNSFGYMSKSAMRNDNTWIYANKLCGLIWIILGAILIVIVSTLILYFKENTAILKKLGFISIGVELVALILSYIPVEIAVRRVS